MKPLLVIIDNGHGGVINGEYQTEGKRSPIWNDGSQVFEGVLMRNIASRLKADLEKAGVMTELLVPEQSDISLSTRVKRANDIAHNLPDCHCVLLSLHSNAGGGKGFEVFTYFGESQSDVLAECIASSFTSEFPQSRLRADMTDGDSDKEANFYMLRKTIMPAVLTESFFMDNEQECKTILMTKQGQDKIVRFHLNALMEYNRCR